MHVAGSAHIYLKDKSRVEKMLSRSDLSDGFSLYRTYEPQDARLPKADFDEELTKLSSMEEKSRNGMYLEIDEARETAKQFRCRFYQNLSLAILGFNARKFGHLGLASELFGFIDNELNPLMRHLVDDRERTIKDLTIPFGGPQNEATHCSEA